MRTRFADWTLWLAVAAALVYLIVSLPILAVLARSEYLRFVFLETIVHWYGKVHPVPYVFIGDSITAGGRNWGFRLTGNPLNARNLAASGYTTRQIHALVGTALSYRPRYVVLMSGTNDILQLQIDAPGIEATEARLAVVDREYQRMLDDISCGGATPIVTLVPYTRNGTANALITQLNLRIRSAAEIRKAPVVDLNKTIAPDGTLLVQYSLDGVHLAPDAYDIWGRKVEKAVEASSDRPYFPPTQCRDSPISSRARSDSRYLR